jgi:Cu+-exporting ATPase
MPELERLHQETRNDGQAGHAPGLAEKVRDPVCGMMVQPSTVTQHYEFESKTYNFCSAGCRAKFIADPTKYLTRSQPEIQTASEGVIYTCPMHPQIR